MKNYKAMDTASIIDYIKSLKIFPVDHELISKEIGDGNLNYVFRVKDVTNNKSVIAKQALPYLKIAGDAWKLTIDRNRIEAEAMKCQNNICEGLVPKVYYHDDVYALTIMEDLGNMEILRRGLMQMHRYTYLPEQIGRFMARNLFLTSDYGMGAMEKKRNMSKFISPELCDITERLVLTNPYIDANDNNINEYIKDYVIKEIWESNQVRSQTAVLKNIFMTKSEALLHGDLHTGSIFVNNKKTVVFDAEFAFYGPYGYDIGLLLANLILNYVSWDGRSDKPEVDKHHYKKYILSLSSSIWNEFVRELHYLWNNESKDLTTKVDGYEKKYITNLLHETVGFCSCEIMRRIIGMAHVPDLDEIEDLHMRAKAQIHGLKIAKDLLLNRAIIDTFDEFVQRIEDIKVPVNTI